MNDLGRMDHPKHRIPVRRVGDISGKQPYGRRQVEGVTSSVHLRVQDVHHSDVVTGLDETVRERGPNESCPTSDEHGCWRQEPLRRNGVTH